MKVKANCLTDQHLTARPVEGGISIKRDLYATAVTSLGWLIREVTK